MFLLHNTRTLWAFDNKSVFCIYVYTIIITIEYLLVLAQKSYTQIVITIDQRGRIVVRRSAYWLYGTCWGDLILFKCGLRIMLYELGFCLLLDSIYIYVMSVDNRWKTSIKKTCHAFIDGRIIRGTWLGGASQTNIYKLDVYGMLFWINLYYNFDNYCIP